MPKRYRVRPPKANTLEAYWGIAERGQPPDVCFNRPGSIDRADARLLHYALCSKRITTTFPEGKIAYEPSFVDELIARGYDIATLQFSIKKKDH